LSAAVKGTTTEKRQQFWQCARRRETFGRGQDCSNTKYFHVFGYKFELFQELYFQIFFIPTRGEPGKQVKSRSHDLPCPELMAVSRPKFK